MGRWVWGITIDSVGLLSMYLLGRRRRLGWLVNLFNLLVLWTAFSITFRQWGFFPGIAMHACVAFQSWLRWGRSDKR